MSEEWRIFAAYVVAGGIILSLLFIFVIVTTGFRYTVLIEAWVEAGPDLVGISDMASLLNFSRQNMRKLIQTHLASFPLPVHEGASALWHLVDVLTWFSETQRRAIPTDLMGVAGVSMGVNLVREVRRVDHQLQAQLDSIA
ncbi:hypothetical protein ABWH88_16540 [Marinobacter adhaerens]|uniref:Prophage CP4-57 regulatory n=3 Tax=Marinobacter adhaerens TaxID=1033846 RepID=A0ABX8IJ17_9GAMM|nr:hypothetical protein [Marinobacter adhaerens]ADP98685.1 prophage CP4-57 regulatory [Marinobacter adhaerens HP15]MBW4976810.1 hypothetical protein [Marinobacter adhaerens]QWV12669.1 hypothetical protein KQ249_18680 [Marinobacter adhaerens]